MLKFITGRKVIIAVMFVILLIVNYRFGLFYYSKKQYSIIPIKTLMPEYKQQILFVTQNNASPKVNKVSPKVNKVSPKVNKVSPKVNKVSPKVNKVSPKVNKVMPKVKIVEPQVILLWNGWYGINNWGFEREPKKPFIKGRCSVTNCVITDDRKKLKESDAVLFHMVDSDNTRPSYKLPNQRWVFLEYEPAWTNKAYKDWNGWFNWTMTYRLDKTTGHIPTPYGTVCKRHQQTKIDFRKIVQGKKKMVAWMVGHCDSTSKRELYVKELIKYIQVDVYGRCGKIFNQSHHCSRSIEKQCRKMLNTDYKFYLSFENSFVPGYITEKFFKCLPINIVPIVRGDGNYALAGPPHSYINTNDFNSPKQLADYLVHLDKNDDEYIKYLKWKELYKADENYILPALDKDCQVMPDMGMCLLCRKLNDPNEPRHVYDDIEAWWGTNRKPTDI